MKIKIHRQPILADNCKIQKLRSVVRTKAPLQTLELEAELRPLGRVGVKFPVAGWYEFRLSTGMSVEQSMLDYHIDEGSLKALRDERLREKQAEKRRARMAS